MNSKTLTVLNTDAGVWAVPGRLQDGEKLRFAVVLEMYAPGTVQDILKPIVALANSDTGGVAFFGLIGKPYFTERDIRVPDDFEQLVAEAVDGIGPKAPKVRTARGEKLAAVVVEPVVGKCGLCFDRARGVDRGAFVVKGYSVRGVTGDTLQSLLDRAGLSDAELSSLITSTESKLSAHLLSQAGLSVDNRDGLKDVQVIAEFGGLTRAGALAFGSESLFDRNPGLGITYRSYDDGAEEAMARELAPVFEKFIRGGAGGITSLAYYLVEWLPVSRPADNPHELFLELLVNAIGHRTLALPNFSDRAHAVHVSAFSDQVRIISPGGLPKSRVRNLGRDRLDGRFSRNPNLMRLLGQMGLARQKGLGLAKVRALAPRLGCRLELIDHADSFEARIVVDPDLAVRVQRYGPASAPTRKRMRPEERHACILDALGDDEMSAQDLAVALGWPVPTVRAAVKVMVKGKLIKRCSRSAKSPRQRYRAS